DKPELPQQLLSNIAEWCIRFTPAVAIDAPDGLLLDASGCAHLWGGEQQYLTAIHKRFAAFGYDVRIAMADTIGAAWAIARFGKETAIIETGQQSQAILPLPAAALRLDPATTERLDKLGLRQVGDF